MRVISLHEREVVGLGRTQFRQRLVVATPKGLAEIGERSDNVPIVDNTSAEVTAVGSTLI